MSSHQSVAQAARQAQTAGQMQTIKRLVAMRVLMAVVTAAFPHEPLLGEGRQEETAISVAATVHCQSTTSNCLAASARTCRLWLCHMRRDLQRQTPRPTSAKRAPNPCQKNGPSTCPLRPLPASPGNTLRRQTRKPLRARRCRWRGTAKGASRQAAIAVQDAAAVVAIPPTAALWRQRILSASGVKPRDAMGTASKPTGPQELAAAEVNTGTGTCRASGGGWSAGWRWLAAGGSSSIARLSGFKGGNGGGGGGGGGCGGGGRASTALAATTLCDVACKLLICTAASGSRNCSLRGTEGPNRSAANANAKFEARVKRILLPPMPTAMNSASGPAVTVARVESRQRPASSVVSA